MLVEIGLVAQLKHGRIDNGAEDERNEKGLRDCFFPQCYANPGVSPMRRRTERGVRRDSCAIQDSSMTGSAKQFASHVWQLRAVSFLIPRLFALRLLVSRSSSENRLFALDA